MNTSLFLYIKASLYFPVCVCVAPLTEVRGQTKGPLEEALGTLALFTFLCIDDLCRRRLTPGVFPKSEIFA